MKSWLEKNGIKIFSTHNDGKPVVTQTFIITLKNKIYKDMTSLLNIVYIDKLANIVNKCNNTYHRTIKMKPIDVKNNTFGKENNDKSPEFKVGDHVRISFVIKKSQKYSSLDICY